MRRRNRWLKTLFWGSVLGVFLALVLVFSGVAVGALEQREGRPVPQPVPFSHAFHAGVSAFPAATVIPPWSTPPTPGFPHGDLHDLPPLREAG